MLQTLLWSWMACSSTFLKYPLAVLAQTPVAYILMYCNAFSTTFTAVRCFQLQLSPFFASIFPLSPWKRLILRLRITRDEIITGYNTKAVNVDAYQKRANNSDTAWKRLQTKPDNRWTIYFKGFSLFDPSVVEKASLVICDGQFSFWAKPTFTRYIF